MNIAFSDAVPSKTSLDTVGDALLQRMSADGVYARSGLLEQVVDALSLLISRERSMEMEVWRFPPVMSRRHLEKSGYLHSFPHFLGCVSCLQGSEGEIEAAVENFDAGREWASALTSTDLVLTPAACYSVYPLVAERGAVPAASFTFDVVCDCFRREPSRQLDRLQSFRMREFVCVGTPEQAASFRERRLARATAMVDRLGLSYRVAPASDPFFGRAGRLMALSQAEQSLKFELLVPMRSAEQPTACMSFNVHRDHFGRAWDLRTENGELAHTACVAFGLERIALALFCTHGLDLRRWPKSVREALAI
jgi:seryl-tRNA synthetase